MAYQQTELFQAASVMVTTHQRLKMFTRYIMFSLPVAIAPYWQLCFSIILNKNKACEKLGLRILSVLTHSHCETTFFHMQNWACYW
jgi:hypothetical protein